MFRDKFWLCLVLTFPVVVWSHEVQHWLGYTAPAFPGSQWIPAVLGTVIFFYGGSVFLRGAASELADRQPGMMTLISLAIIVAFTASFAATLGVFEVDVWWELATLITIMVLGHWLEMKAITQARGALDALAALLPDKAERITGTGTGTGTSTGTDAGASISASASISTSTSTSTEQVALADLRAGDVVLVRPGARVPADGTVIDGTADIDESMITGESHSVAKQPGDAVVAGTVAAGGSLRVRITAVGEQTALSGIMRLVAAAQASGSRAQALADRAAALLFYVALGSGIVTLIYWWITGDREHALIRTATVLVIACPHALGLAIPLVIAISTSLGAQNGLLVKNRLALERARNLDLVIFDKTGTLTKGTPALSGIATAASAEGASVGAASVGAASAGSRGGAALTDDALLALAASVEADSEHPIAKAIVTAAEHRGLARRPASDFKALPGRGASASIDGRTIAIGGPRLMEDAHAAVPPALDARVKAWSAEGKTVLYVIRDTHAIGALAVEDEIRPESAEAVDALHALGLRVAMITGDSQAVADSVAKRLRIDEVAAQVLPADKAAAVQRFQAGGTHVAMVGDGVNDAPALATADVGMAIGAGTDVAVESAGIILMRSDPRDTVRAIQLSRATWRKMVQNLVWATAYNLIAIPVAAGLFVRWNFDLPMSVGAIAMSASTIIVALNAQLLRRFHLG